jgi:hypothetical protein
MISKIYSVLVKLIIIGTYHFENVVVVIVW